MTNEEYIEKCNRTERRIQFAVFLIMLISGILSFAAWYLNTFCCPYSQ